MENKYKKKKKKHWEPKIRVRMTASLVNLYDSSKYRKDERVHDRRVVDGSRASVVSTLET